jgi:hypothetical protein
MGEILRGFTPLFPDNRGTLGVLDFSRLPFDVRRVFWVTSTGPSIVRADHAHLRCSQFLVCARGQVEFETTQTSLTTESGILSSGDALLLEPKTWLKLYGFTTDALLLVFCDWPYDPSEYINDFNTFMMLD